MIELVGVGCRLGSRWGVRDVSFKVHAGEVFGVTGANGSGKSLLLAICATAVRLDTGVVRVAGADVRTAVRAVRRVIGFVPETIGWDPRMTVHDDLEFFAAAHGLPPRARQAAVADALDTWSLGTAAAEPMGVLSHGLARRVALARAWLHHPRVLLLDEPACGLDTDTRATLWRKLALHTEEGGAAVVVSHDVDHLSRVARRVGVMVSGRLDQVLDVWAASSS